MNSKTKSKIKSVGIIAEYNPFHNGHLYHLNKSKEITGADIVVVAMSGNFVQRGQFAMADKWARAEAAVSCGADLVVEIPVVFACNSAPYFAKGGVEVLENLGVDFISFGSESGNIDELINISTEIASKSQEIEEYIKEQVKLGLTYPRARAEAVANLISEEAAEIIANPNNLLALEYLKNMKSAEAVTVKRNGPGYNDIEAQDEMASATAIRYLLEEKQDVSMLMPQESVEAILGGTEYEFFGEGCGAHEPKSMYNVGMSKPSAETIFKMIVQCALTKSADELDSVMAGGEGLGNKLKNAIRTVKNLDELIEELKSKRYTRTRIERFLMQVLLNITEADGMPNYIRVLAFNEKGSAYLKEIKKQETCKLPVITNINKEIKDFPQIQKTLEKDILAGDLYNLAADRDLYKFSDFVRKPYVHRG